MLQTSKGLIKEYYFLKIIPKFDNLDEMQKFLEKCNYLKPTEKEKLNF